MAVTMDGWTSIAKDSYMAVTGHFLYCGALTQCLLGLINTSNITHSGKNLSSILHSEVFANYSQVHIVCATTDNAANMIATAQKLKVKHNPCFAHSLQLVVNSAISSVESHTDPNDAQLTGLNHSYFFIT